MNHSSNGQQQLKRELSERHIQMIALGGAIGVGLFYGSATTIQMGGPAVSLAYIFGGFIIYIIMRALGEMAVDNPTSGSFSAYAYQYIGPFAGFLTGWTYWFLWLFAGMSEITVVGSYINYWFPDVPLWVSALVALIVMVSVNLTHVKAFGEFEFWFALIKVVAILGMIGAGLLLILGIGSGEPVGLSNLWAHGGFMPNGLSGVVLALVMVMFSFGGTELIGVTAGEARDPQKAIPKAINKVIARILIFYVAALLIMMALYPWNEIGIQGSPFVLIFDRIGIPAAASVINLVVITAALSAFNSGLFSTGRMLYNLSLQGNAPKIFSRLSSNGVPRNGILFSSLLILTAVVLNYFLPGEVFLITSSITTIAVIFVWTLILISNYRFHQLKSPEDLRKLMYRMPCHKVLISIALGFMPILVILMGFIPNMRIALVVGPIWLIIMYISYRVSRSKKGDRE